MWGAMPPSSRSPLALLVAFGLLACGGEDPVPAGAPEDPGPPNIAPDAATGTAGIDAPEGVDPPTGPPAVSDDPDPAPDGEGAAPADPVPGGDDQAPADPPDDPPPGTRFVRVRTLDSPSWVAWSEIEVTGAAGVLATAEASGEEAGQGPGRALDGDEATAWNSGGFAPASITLDLGEPIEVRGVRLLVAQTPPGPTVHTLHLGDAGGRFDHVHTFDQATEDGQWLEWRAPSPPDDPPDDPPPDDPPPDDPPPDDPPPDDPPLDLEGLSPGLAWVRTNPMFISGLAVQAGAPRAQDVDVYFDEFGATAAHLWTTGAPNEVQGWLGSGRAGLRWLTWLRNDGTSPVGGAVAGGLGQAPPGRIGYQLGDEPGLDRQGMDDMREIAEGARAVRAVDPGALLVCNFSYGVDGISGLIDFFADDVGGDVLSYDRYTRSRGAYETLAQFRAAGLRWGLPYWRYLRSFAYQGVGDFSPEADMRWDAMSGLVFGYTGHTWFLYQVADGHGLAPSFFAGTGDLSAVRTERFAHAAALNRQMAQLGRAVTQLTSTDIRYIPAFELFGLEQPRGTANWAPGAGDDPYLTFIDGDAELDELLIGFFRDDAGEVYVMFQNPHHPGGDFPNRSNDPMTVRLEFDFSDDPDVDPTRLRRLDPDTGAVLNVALEAHDGGAAALQVILPAGDAMLYKYATGAPFALGP